MPAAPTLAGLSNAAGLTANLGSNQAQSAKTSTASSSTGSGGIRAAAAVLAALDVSLNANISPTSNASGLTGVPSSIASTSAIEVQAILDSPGTLINSTIQDVSFLDSTVIILDPFLSMLSAVTTAPTMGSREAAAASTDLLITLFNEFNNSV